MGREGEKEGASRRWARGLKGHGQSGGFGFAGALAVRGRRRGRFAARRQHGAQQGPQERCCLLLRREALLSPL